MATAGELKMIEMQQSSQALGGGAAIARHTDQKPRETYDSWYDALDGKPSKRGEIIEKQQPSQALGAIESESNTLVEQHQREPVTMATLTNLLKDLMEKWHETLQTTITTGYWKDTEACDLVISAYGDHIANALKGGEFSGDVNGALEAWTNLTTAEANHRRELMDIARANIQPPNPNIWWMVLECHPHAQPDDVKKAFREKMKECHPDLVAGMAPPIRKLASDMAEKLTKAMREYETEETAAAPANAHPASDPSPITVYGPDGSTFDFPNGMPDPEIVRLITRATSKDVIVSALSKRYGRSMGLDPFRDEHGNIHYSVRE
jgi:hypothetical protein